MRCSMFYVSGAPSLINKNIKRSERAKSHAEGEEKF